MHKYKIWYMVSGRALKLNLHLLGGKSAPWRVCVGPLRQRHVASAAPGTPGLASPAKAATHPHSVQLLGLGIQAAANAQQIENGLVPYAVQQPFGEIADVVLPEVPRGEDPGRDAGLRVRVTAVTEVFPQVFAVPQPLHELCRAHGRVGRVSTWEGSAARLGWQHTLPRPFFPFPPQVQDCCVCCCEHHTPPRGAWESYGRDWRPSITAAHELFCMETAVRKIETSQTLLNLEVGHCKLQCSQKNTRGEVWWESRLNLPLAGGLRAKISLSKPS